MDVVSLIVLLMLWYHPNLVSVLFSFDSLHALKYIIMYVIIIPFILLFFSQYLRPFAGSKYTDAAYKLRQIGRHCIEQRIKSIQNNEDVPHDILTQIISITQKEENIQVEDLVDDFVTFYAAGMTWASLSQVNLSCLFHMYMYIKWFSFCCFCKDIQLIYKRILVWNVIDYVKVT